MSQVAPEPPIGQTKRPDEVKDRLATLQRRDWLALCLVFLALFVSFNWAPHLVLVDWLLGSKVNVWHDSFGFSDFHNVFGSESDYLVSMRLQQNVEEGLFSSQMLLGSSSDVYTSQSGFGGWLLTLPSTLFRSWGWFGVPLMYALVAAGNALLATAAVGFVARALSKGAAVLVFVALLQPWPSAMAHSTYWMIGLKVLPAVALIALFTYGRDTILRVLAVSIGFTLLAALSGYEFLTVVVACQLAVLTYYAVVRNNKLREALLLLLAGFIGAVLGFAAAGLIQILQLWIRLGSASEGINSFIYNSAKRTGSTGMRVDPMFAESLSVSPKTVLDIYLGMPIIGSPAALPLIHVFTMVTFLCVCATVIIIGLGKSNTTEAQVRESAMGAAWFISLLGPLGWFLLARPHSFIHQFINFALWYIPTIPLGLAILWAPVRGGLAGLWKQPLQAAVIAGTVAAIALFYLYSLATVR
jgi:hypothetical protein